MTPIYVTALLALATPSAPGPLVVSARNFEIPATQQIAFVPLEHIDPADFSDPTLARSMDLKSLQTDVKSQGARGACTYFALAGLVESLIKRDTNRNVDISEEYLAWAGKVLKNLRAMDEDSSVAVNAAAVQDHGYMLESDLPYQQSWFDRGMPCEGLRGRSNIDPKCFSHSGPRADQLGLVIPGQQFIFEAVDSRSIDVIRAMNRFGNPVTVSILGHPEMWRASTHTGQFVLTARHKQECQSRKVHCSGHAALIVGYDITRRLFMIKNSWGRAWGESGYGTISFDYLEQMSHRKFLTGYTQY